MFLKKHDCLEAKDTGSKYNSNRVFYSSYSDSAVSEIPVFGTGKNSAGSENNRRKTGVNSNVLPLLDVDKWNEWVHSLFLLNFHEYSGEFKKKRLRKLFYER
ncbi:hypothetical protein [Gimesia sp.]|uniref:hypothetical protein n=1 Tax=Gimesia sp. TaxID=2024833 RepID=UPI003A938A5E